jgi:hypothetical protein
MRLIAHTRKFVGASLSDEHERPKKPDTAKTETGWHLIQPLGRGPRLRSRNVPLFRLRLIRHFPAQNISVYCTHRNEGTFSSFGRSITSVGPDSITRSRASPCCDRSHSSRCGSGLPFLCLIFNLIVVLCV